MADRLWKRLWQGQYKKLGYAIYPILKDEDHLYSYWYAVVYHETLDKGAKSGDFIKWQNDLCMNHMIDIRTLSTYIPAKSIYEEIDGKYVIPIIRNAIKKGEIKPV